MLPLTTKPISMIKSWNFWREVTGQDNFLNIQLSLNEFGYCKYCDNRGSINQKGVGIIRCICDLKYHESRYMYVKSLLESIHEEARFDTFREWGDSEATRTQSRYLRDSVIEWTDNASNWLVIQGNNGCGKSHLLSAINNSFTPWTLYLSMTDLEGMYFESLNNDSEGMNFQVLIDTISRHPILLLDDIGSDQGKDFAKSATRKIIDFRYRMYSEFPTVIATNYAEQDLKAYDRRIGDRVFDKTNNTIIRTPLKSYRAFGGVE